MRGSQPARSARLDAVFSHWQPGGARISNGAGCFPSTRRVCATNRRNAPLLNLAARMLLSDLTADYMHAQLCQAALHAFAAENQARMEAMAAARRQIERQLAVVAATQRRVRQEEITAEIIELAAGETASHSTPR